MDEGVLYRVLAVYNQFDLNMLTAEDRAEAEKKLKSINQEMAQEEQVKSRTKKFNKTIIDLVNSIKQDPKKQLELLRNLTNNDLINKIAAFQTSNTTLLQLQDKIKSKREQVNRETLSLLDDKNRFEGGIDEIKKTILNIQKTVKQSVEEQTNKRKKIEDDLEKSLDDIRSKITQFQTESVRFDQENVELQQKIDAIKGKLSGIQDSFKVKADEKDEENRLEREELTNKLKVLQVEVEKATELNKEFAALEKQNFDNKIALYLKTKKFPQYFSSFESSAKTLDSCKEELLKGVHRMNVADESIDQSKKVCEQFNLQFLQELKRQKEKQGRIDEIKKEKEGVRGRIIELQNRLKEKKAKA